MSAEYKSIYAKKPAGLLPFTTNSSSDKLNVWPTEIFCRFLEESGEICGNERKFESANSLRLHIKNKHGQNLCHPFKKPSAETVKVANLDFKNCHEAVLAFDSKLRLAAAAHHNVAKQPETPRRRKKAVKQLETPSRHRKKIHLRVNRSASTSQTPVTSSSPDRIDLTSGDNEQNEDGGDEEEQPGTTSGLENHSIDPNHTKFELKDFEQTRAGITKPNLTRMRRAANVPQLKCSYCKENKLSPCPDLAAENWETHGCRVLGVFIQPEDENAV